MNVRIITKGGWILQRIAKEVAKQTNAKISDKSDLNADINYFVNYALLTKKTPNAVAYFTHQEGKLMKVWKRAESLCKGAVYIADRYTPNVRHTKKIYPTGFDYSAVEPVLKVGVVGRIYPSGRKGEDDVLKIDKAFSVGDIEWHFMGSGWDNFEYKNKATFTDWQSDQQAIKFYKNIDVLLCTSKIEGGPIPVLEAIKVGTFVISYDVGNVEEWGTACDVAIVGDFSKMIYMLKALGARKLRRHSLCQRTWEDFGKRHLRFFKQLCK